MSGCALGVGGYGALGSAISSALAADGLRVLRSSRTAREDDPEAVVLPTDGTVPDNLPVLDSVVWAQGINVNDSLPTFTDEDLDHVLDVNVVSVARQMRALVQSGAVTHGARLVVLSSVWEVVARPGKFSYTVAKAALGGLVRAAALDLAPLGVLVNAVLPGGVETPMTRAMLTAEQIAGFERATGADRMVAPNDVAAVVAYLASGRNTGMTGQSVTVDLGFTVGRIL